MSNSTTPPSWTYGLVSRTTPMEKTTALTTIKITREQDGGEIEIDLTTEAIKKLARTAGLAIIDGETRKLIAQVIA